MTLWTPTKQPRNGRLLNPRLSSDTERLNRRSVDAAGVDVALCIRRSGWGNHKKEGGRDRRRRGRRRTRRGAKWIRYCYYPGERRKFCPVPPVTLRALSPRFNAATNSSLTRPRNKLARKFELFRVGEGGGRGEKGISVAKEKKGASRGRTRNALGYQETGVLCPLGSP